MRRPELQHTRPVWAEVSASRLAANYAAVHDTAGMDVLAVVKADAYGHGARECAPVLAGAGAQWLGVTSVEEGIAVRQALNILPQGFAPRILVMCSVWAGEAEAAIQYGLTPVVWEPYHLDLLHTEAIKRGLPAASVAVHLEVDTGMARQGVLPGEQLAQFLDLLRERPTLRLEAAMTHLASAEVARGEQTSLQMERFAVSVNQIADAGLKLDLLHCGNTSGIDTAALHRLPALAAKVFAKPMARSGLALYGYALDVEGGEGRLQVQPALTWKTRIVSLREVQQGDRIGYNGTFVAEKAMRLALLPVGYADGFRRELSSSLGAGAVLINGHRAPIVGRVSMDLTMVDVSGTNAAIGDEVVLLGDSLGADEEAAWVGTIPYEILCGISARVPRIVVE